MGRGLDPEFYAMLGWGKLSQILLLSTVLLPLTLP